MVLDVMDANSIRPGYSGIRKRGRQTSHFHRVLRSAGEPAPVSGARSDTEELPCEMRLGVARDRDVCEVGLIRALEAPLRRERRESSPVFDAIEAFFFNRRGEATIGEQSR